MASAPQPQHDDDEALPEGAHTAIAFRDDEDEIDDGPEGEIDFGHPELDLLDEDIARDEAQRDFYDPPELLDEGGES